MAKRYFSFNKSAKSKSLMDDLVAEGFITVKKNKAICVSNHY